MVAYSCKARFIAPICVGLGVPIPPLVGVRYAAGMPILPKLQTFRAIGKRRHARPGETIQLYYAMRSPACFLIGEGICTDVLPAIIWPGFAMMLGGKIQGARQIRRFALDDGFKSTSEMQDFFRKEHGVVKIEGVVIKWRAIDAA